MTGRAVRRRLVRRDAAAAVAPQPPPRPPPPPATRRCGSPACRITPSTLHRARRANRRLHRKARRATRARVSLRLSRPATITATVARGRPGVRRGSQCVAPPRNAQALGPRLHALRRTARAAARALQLRPAALHADAGVRAAHAAARPLPAAARRAGRERQPRRPGQTAPSGSCADHLAQVLGELRHLLRRRLADRLLGEHAVGRASRASRSRRSCASRARARPISIRASPAGLPFASRARLVMTTRCAAASRSCTVIVPVKRRHSGPSCALQRDLEDVLAAPLRRASRPARTARRARCRRRPRRRRRAAPGRRRSCRTASRQPTLAGPRLQRGERDRHVEAPLRLAAEVVLAVALVVGSRGRRSRSGRRGTSRARPAAPSAARSRRSCCWPRRPRRAGLGDGLGAGLVARRRSPRRRPTSRRRPATR